MIQNLEGDGFTMVPFGQGFASMDRAVAGEESLIWFKVSPRLSAKWWMISGFFLVLEQSEVEVY